MVSWRSARTHDHDTVASQRAVAMLAIKLPQEYAALLVRQVRQRRGQPLGQQTVWFSGFPKLKTGKGKGTVCQGSFFGPCFCLRQGVSDFHFEFFRVQAPLIHLATDHSSRCSRKSRSSSACLIDSFSNHLPFLDYSKLRGPFGDIKPIDFRSAD